MSSSSAAIWGGASIEGRDIASGFWGAFIERDPKGHQANMAQLVAWAAEGMLSAHTCTKRPWQARQCVDAIVRLRQEGGSFDPIAT